MRRLLLLIAVVMAGILAFAVGAGAQTADCYDDTATNTEGACPDPTYTSTEIAPPLTSGSGGASPGSVSVKKTDGSVERRSVPPGNERAAAQAIEQEPGVEYAEPTAGAKPGAVPNDPYITTNNFRGVIFQTNLRNNPMGFPSAWDGSGGSKSAGEVVAIMDTGVDTAHPDIAGQVLAQRDLTVSPADDIANPYDYHGTAVTSIANAKTNTTPAQGMAGAMWNGNNIHAKVCTNTCLFDDILEGAQWIVAQKNAGVNVKQANMSFGDTNTSDSQFLRDAVNLLRQNDILVVSIPGNDNQSVDPVTNPAYPACYEGVLGVGGTTNDVSQPYWTSTTAGTNYDATAGNTIAGHAQKDKCVDVYAPGEAVFIAVLSNGTPCHLSNGDPYCAGNGTSFAAPHAAAVSAMVRDKNPSFTEEQTFDRIVGEAKSRSWGTQNGITYPTVKILSAKCAVKPGAKGCG